MKNKAVAGHDVSRRQAILGTMAVAGASVLGNLAIAEESPSKDIAAITKGRINQSVCQWCYSKMKVEDLAANAAKMGIKGMDLVGPEHWATLKKYNLIGTMTPSHGITKGLNRKENWEECLGSMRKGIEATADAGFPNVICFSGNRAGMSDDEGLANCAAALKQILGLAEEKKVTICMELLNSRVNHKDYMCDLSQWGVKLVKAVGSDRFKLLYDIYHMQIMEAMSSQPSSAITNASAIITPAAFPDAQRSMKRRNSITPRSCRRSSPQDTRDLSARNLFRNAIRWHHSRRPRKSAMCNESF